MTRALIEFGREAKAKATPRLGTASSRAPGVRSFFVGFLPEMIEQQWLVRVTVFGKLLVCSKKGKKGRKNSEVRV